MEFLRVFLVCNIVVGTYSVSIQNKTFDGGKYATVEMFESLKRNMTEIMTRTEISDMSNQVSDKSPVYFYVTLSGDRTYNYNSIVIFDSIHYNEGNHFNSGDSIFVVPVTGVYLFSWTLQTYTSKAAYSELRVANAVKGRLHMILGSSAGHFSSSRVIICPANKDDHVWIQTGGYTTENFFAYYRDSQSSFMGVLLFKI